VRNSAPQGFVIFCPAYSFSAQQGEVMPALNPASAGPATTTRTPPDGLKELAGACLRRNPYLALKHVTCDCRDGVLVLRGCLPSYYLKQVAQEVVARLEGVEGVENEIKVVPPAFRADQG
jgi:hypothetical protein